MWGNDELIFDFNDIDTERKEKLIRNKGGVIC